MIIKLYPTNLLWLNFIQNIFNYSWYLGWIFDLQFSYIIWKYFLTSPHLYYCSYVLIPSRKIFGHFLIKLYTECGGWSEWSFRELQKKICIVWFQKNCPEFFTCTTYIDKLFKSEIFLLIFSLNDLLFTAGIIEAFNINHLHIFYNLFYQFVLSI